ncbi:MAG: GspE/PulE/PilB domain-containing protein [Syntrophorhabdaceae bacterium]
MDKPLREMRLGELLVKLGYLDQKQVEEALAYRDQQKIYAPLGEVLKERGLISSKQLRDILFKYRKEILLGELLLKLGAITADQLYEALREQKQTGMKLGKIFVRKGNISPTTLVDALCIILGVTKLHPKKDLIDKDLLSKASITYFQKRRVVPLSFDKATRTVKVVMEDPTDAEAIGDLEKMFGAEVEPVICSPGEIDLLFSRGFDVWSGK